MSYTQIGISTVSDELLEYIKEQIRNGTLNWSDLIDAPEYEGQDGKYLQAFSGGGNAGMAWADLPAAGLNWQLAQDDVTAEDKVGFLASDGITITLPLTPVEGTLVAIADHQSEFDVKPVTVVGGSGLQIEGEDELILDLRNAYVQLIFEGSYWKIAQVNHPFNIQEITEETFPGGQLQYNLGRVPAGSSSILVTVNGVVVPTNQYSVVGNLLTFGTSQVGQISIRYIGTPNINRVSDVPVGAMMYFPKGSAVDGWLDVTGASISRSVYPDLVDYLTGDTSAEIAYLPDPRGNFIRVWDQGSGLDKVGLQSIPNVLADNAWGRWLDTTFEATSRSVWDGNSTTVSKVKVDHGYVGYRFDVPVSVDEVSFTTVDPVGGIHVPTTVELKASNDGITWVTASNVVSGPFQNLTTSVSSTTTDLYRYWAIFGTGGAAYPNDPDYYWGVSSVIFTGSTESRIVGGFQPGSVGDPTISLGGVPAGTGQVQNGTGTDALVAGGDPNTVTGAEETRPNNQAYVLKIKAFHYQSGSLSTSNVTALRNEVSRLSTQVNDGTSYVQSEPPENPSENARWFDTNSGRTYIWFNDGDSYQWVDDSPQSAASTRESINASLVLTTNTNTPRQLNDRFTDITNVLDHGGRRNSNDDSYSAFVRAGAGPVFIPHGSYRVSTGNFAGNIYFSFGPVIITGAATGIVVKDLLA